MSDLAEMITWAEWRLAVCESREALRHNAPRYRDLVAMLRSLALLTRGESYAAGFDAAKVQAVALCELQTLAAKDGGDPTHRFEMAVCGGIADGIRSLTPSPPEAAATPPIESPERGA